MGVESFTRDMRRCYRFWDSVRMARLARRFRSFGRTDRCDEERSRLRGGRIEEAQLGWVWRRVMKNGVEKPADRGTRKELAQQVGLLRRRLRKRGGEIGRASCRERV